MAESQCNAPACNAGCTMPEYKAFLIKNDKIDIAATVITADSDEDAIEQTKPLVDGHDIELWLGPRFVMGFKARGANNGKKKTP